MSKVQLEAVHQIAARLANTGQVLQAWSRAMGDGEDLLQRRLSRAVRELQAVVGALTVEDAAFLELERQSDDVPAFPGTLGASVVASTGDAFGLRGRSEMISLVEMIAFLSSMGRDGVLQVCTKDEEYALELTSGQLTYITVSPKSDELRLGGILVADRALSQEDLEWGAADVREGEFLGESLVRQGLVTEEVLQRALAHQALLAFCRMHRVGTGFDFQFEEGTQVREKKDLCLSVSALLLESARLNDEARRESEWVRAVDEALDPDLPAGERSAPSEQGAEEQAASQNGAAPPEAAASREEPEPTPVAEEPEPGPAKDEETQVSDVEGTLRAARALDAYRDALQEMLLGKELELPVLPQGAAGLLSLCWAEDFDAERLMEWVNRDQTLCAHVLRVANSAAYAPVSPISSAQTAIARLGLDKLREVAMGLTLKQRVFQLPGWEETVRFLWRGAAVTSGFGAAVAKRAGLGAVRGAMVGLLLDVGKPIVLHALYDLQETVGQSLTRPIAEQLMEEFHGEIGELLADAWQLPEWLSVVMRHHDDYGRVDEHRHEAMVGHLAVHLARWASREVDEDGLRGLAVWEDLSLGERDLGLILEQRARILQLADVYA